MQHKLIQCLALARNIILNNLRNDKLFLRNNEISKEKFIILDRMRRKSIKKERNQLKKYAITNSYFKSKEKS